MGVNRRGTYGRAQGRVDDDQLAGDALGLGQEGHSLRRGQVAVEVSGQDPAEGQVGERGVQGVAD